MLRRVVDFLGGPSRAASLAAVCALSATVVAALVRLSKPAPRVAVICAIGTAHPEETTTRETFLEICDSLNYPTDMRDRVQKIVANSGIDTRYTINTAPPAEFVRALDAPGARGALWGEKVPTLAVAAARDALRSWTSGSAADITHVVVHSCTGFAAPGLDFELITQLGLSSRTRKLGVNFMGCFGGMTALFVAKSLIEADSTGRAVVLVVCAEACTLHVSTAVQLELIVGNAIFGDGAGAAIVSHAGFRGTAPPKGAAAASQAGTAVTGSDWEWSLGAMSSEIVPDSAGAMTWKQSADGGRYDMWLSRSIPQSLTALFSTRGFELLSRVGLFNPFGVGWALHPGGKAILAGFEEGLSKIGVRPDGLEHSHAVLAEHGNMSSATIFFVLQRVLSSTKKNAIFFAGFGPGLTVEFGAINRVRRA